MLEPVRRTGECMSKARKTTIEVQGTEITVLAVEFLGIWESVHNPVFNYGEFATIKSNAGLNSYKISVKDWVGNTNAIGLRATAGRYGGTYAHNEKVEIRRKEPWSKQAPGAAHAT